MIRPMADGGPLVVYGAGGHGRVVAEAATAAGLHVLGFLDDSQPNPGDMGWPVLDRDDPRLADAGFIVGIGDNAARARLLEQLRQRGRRLQNVVHPTAWVSPSARLGQGVFIGPHAIVHTAAQLGDATIVNSGAIVEHDGALGVACHLAPGSALGGHVRVGDRTLVGLGARVLPRVQVGHDVTIGAGAVVVRDVPAGTTVKGVPAR